MLRSGQRLPARRLDCPGEQSHCMAAGTQAPASLGRMGRNEQKIPRRGTVQSRPEPESAMSYGITRDEALELVREHLDNENLVKHSLASEAVLRALARRLGEDEDKWGLAGLLHDLDAESQPDLTTHTSETVAILSSRGVDPEIIDAIRMHNEKAHGDKRSTPFHHALAAGETITGLVIATALVYPDKKLASVKPKSVRKRFKEKAFARGADREIIRECEHLGLKVGEFCDLALAALCPIAEDLGL